MRKTFFLTLALFFLVWAFAWIDRIIDSNLASKSLSFESAGQLSCEPAETLLRLHADVSQIACGQLASLKGEKNADEVAEIDRQIQELEAMKRGYEARALRHDDQAQRLQFEDRANLETRRHVELAEENRAKAQRVQEEIDRLEAVKQKLLK